MSKVKVTAAVFRKKKWFPSSTFINRQILVQLLVKVECDNIFQTFAIQHFRGRAKVMVGIFEKKFCPTLAPLVMDQL